MTFPRARKTDDPEAGFTLLEVIVSFALFAIVATSATTAIVTGTKATNDTRDQSTATSLAQADLQQARALEYPDYPQAAAARKITLQGKTFTLSRAISATCPALYTPGQPTSMQVTTTVTWAGARNPVVMGTEIAC